MEVESVFSTDHEEDLHTISIDKPSLSSDPFLLREVIQKIMTHIEDPPSGLVSIDALSDLSSREPDVSSSSGLGESGGRDFTDLGKGGKYVSPHLANEDGGDAFVDGIDVGYDDSLSHPPGFTPTNSFGSLSSLHIISSKCGGSDLVDLEATICMG